MTLEKDTKTGSHSSHNESRRKKQEQSAKDEQTSFFKPFLEMTLLGSLTLAELVLKKAKRHWNEFICSGQLGMIFAPRGTGKTFFVLALAIAMTKKAKFLGYGPEHRRRVIILDGEMDLNSIQSRLVMVAESLKVQLSNRLRIFTPETFSGLMPALTTTDGQRVIDDLIGKDWDILFVDNYSAWSADGRETAESWAPFVKWMLSHKREGRTVIVVHHSGKNGDQRGSSKHEDALDFSIALRPALQDAQDGSLNFQFEWRKARHLPSDQKVPFVVSLSKDADGKMAWTRTEGPIMDKRIKQAAELKAAGRSLSEIAKAMGVDKSTISRWLKQ